MTGWYLLFTRMSQSDLAKSDHGGRSTGHPAMRRFAAMPHEERFKFLRGRRAPYASSFVLFLIPLFALALDLFYRERRYAEHLVFGLHCQTFLLFVLLAQARPPAVLATALSYWMLAYLVIVLKRVYGEHMGGHERAERGKRVSRLWR